MFGLKIKGKSRSSDKPSTVKLSDTISGLEKTVESESRSSLPAKALKYAVPAGVAYFQVPLHEGLHALTAKVLPGISSTGVELSDKLWYAPAFQFLTNGFYHVKDFTIDKAFKAYKGMEFAGMAKITEPHNLVGNISAAVTSALPEVATLTLGFYWLKYAMENINQKGKKLYSVALTYCAIPLIAGSYNYLIADSLSPNKTGDYFNFTKHILGGSPIAQGIAPYVTFLGAAAMLGGSLYLANKLSSLFGGNKEKKEKSTFGF